MQEPPAELSDSTVLAAVRAGWDDRTDQIVHLDVGFGAHHWRAGDGVTPRLFVTYDRFGSRHRPETLESAYEAATALAAALEFVVAPLRSRQGRVLLPIGHGALSCTPWVAGQVVGEGPLTDRRTALANIADLARLHACAPPGRLRRWQPMAASELVDRLSGEADRTWRTGPFGESARRAVAAAMSAIQCWVRRYRVRADEATDRPWVVTHGETHTRNQLRTEAGIRFVDWESLLLAPRERDLSTLVQAGYGSEVDADPAMVELFDLEWRLSEIDEYARWFAAPHAGTADDAIAYRGLLDQLSRGPWWPPDPPTATSVEPA